MKYEQRVVCFLDILGFGKHVEQTVQHHGDDESRIEQIASAFLEIRELLDIDRPDEREGREVTQFSDSVVISFPASERSGVFWCLLDILWVQMALLRHGLLCRGGIALGKVVHTEKLLFGPAMNNAYTLESKAALYPRVILEDSIVELGESMHAPHHNEEMERKAITSIVRRDGDGMWYIDYLTRAQSELDDPELDYPEYVFRLHALISKGLKSKTPDLRIKYQWMKEKFGPHVKGIKAWARDLPVGDELREVFEELPDL